MSGTMIPLMGQVADPLKWMLDTQNILKMEADRYKTQAETETEKERPAQVRANAGLLGAQTGLAGADTELRREETVSKQLENQLRRLQLPVRQQALDATNSSSQPVPVEPNAPWAGDPNVTGVQLLQGNRGTGGPAAAPAPVAATPPAPAAARPAAAAVPVQNPLAMYSTQSEPAAPSEVGTPALDETMKRLRAQQAGGGNELAAAAPPAPPVATGVNPLAAPAPAAAAAPATAAGGSNAQAAMARQASREGVVVNGITVPRAQYAQAAVSADPVKEIGALGEKRVQVLSQLAASAQSEAQWKDNVRFGYESGWLSMGDVHHLWNNFAGRDGFVQSLAKPETMVGFQQALVGQGFRRGANGQPEVDPNVMASQGMIPVERENIGPDGRGTGTYSKVEIPKLMLQADTLKRYKEAGGQTVTVQVEALGSNGQTYKQRQEVPAAAFPQGGGAPGAAGGQPGAGGAAGAPAPGAAAGGGMPFERYAELTHKIEGSGKNPRSTASGNYGFVDPTWAATVRKYAPELAAGKTDEQINATVPKGVDPPGYPGFEARMLHAFTSDNAAALQAAGLPVNASSLHLAHRLGADGMRKLVTATAPTPISAIASEEVLKANPEFRRMNVGNFVDRIIGTFGNDPVNLGPRTGGEALGIKPAAPAGAAAAAGPPGSLAPQQGLPPGSYVGKPSLPPERQIAADLDKSLVEKDASYVSDLQDAAKASLQGQAQLLNVRTTAAGLPTGSYGDARAAAANFIETFGGDWGKKFAAAVAGIDASKAGAWQELAKQTLSIAGQAEQQVAGARGGFNLVRLYQKAFPGLETQPGAFRDMVNLFTIGHQYTIDHAREAQPYYQQQREAFTAAPGAKPYQPMSTFDEGFQRQNGANGPVVYVAATAAMNGKPYAEWTKGLTHQQIVSALQVVGRADPTATVLDQNGKPRPVGAAR